MRRWSQLRRREMKINYISILLNIHETIAVLSPTYATGTTYAKFNNFRLHSFVSSFEQAIARVCTCYRTRERNAGTFVTSLTSDLTELKRLFLVPSSFDLTELNPAANTLAGCIQWYISAKNLPEPIIPTKYLTDLQAASSMY